MLPTLIIAAACGLNTPPEAPPGTISNPSYAAVAEKAEKKCAECDKAIVVELRRLIREQVAAGLGKAKTGRAARKWCKSRGLADSSGSGPYGGCVAALVNLELTPRFVDPPPDIDKLRASLPDVARRYLSASVTQRVGAIEQAEKRLASAREQLAQAKNKQARKPLQRSVDALANGLATLYANNRLRFPQMSPMQLNVGDVGEFAYEWSYSFGTGKHLQGWSQERYFRVLQVIDDANALVQAYAETSDWAWGRRPTPGYKQGPTCWIRGVPTKKWTTNDETLRLNMAALSWLTLEGVVGR